MMRYLFTCLVFLSLISTNLFAQSHVFNGELIPNYRSNALDEQFKAVQVYELDIERFDQFVKNRSGVIPFHLSFGNDYRWNLEITKNVDLISPDFKLITLKDGGERIEEQIENKAYKGWNTNPIGGDVRLTIDHQYLYGLVEQGDETIFVEPLYYYDKEAPKNHFVVYKESNVIFTGDRTCALVKMDENIQKLKNQYDDQIEEENQRSLACKELELAVASDWLMHVDYGSCGGVSNHITGILNNVQTNWDDEFNDEIQIVQVTHFCVDCNGCDPWTSSTDAGALLSSFASWAPGGFGVPHDMGQLWTDRNFNGSTVGIAYLNSVCGSLRYHCNQDYTSNGTSLRVLTSHEMGHNFSATHDASGAPFIMAPAVNSSNSWSSTSQSQINSKIASSFCLGPCGNQSPPDPDFDANQTNICEEDFVQFTDQSTNSPDEWNWYFEGGNPQFSSQQNPIVQYNNAGDFLVELEACNAAGCNTLAIPNYIHVEPLPEADFNHSVSPDPTDRTVTFSNFSTNNAAYDWDFGDGNFSTEKNPIHEYMFDGEYQVTLTVTNNCGVATMQQTVVVATLPEADFSAVPEDGCTVLIVEYANESSQNSENFFWEFEGGDPMTSDEPNPVVTYEEGGTFDVKLTVSNSVGSDIKVIEDMIFVETLPDPSFEYDVDGLEVEFEQTTDNGDSFAWDFGDGTSSTQENPSHTYQGFGTYTVLLEVANECGAQTIEQEITVTEPPSAAFSASTQEGCAPFEVTFTDESTENTTEWEWLLPGADPDQSFDPSPTVTYEEAGTYSVTLIAYNDSGSDTLVQTDYIQVGAAPDAGFDSEITDHVDVAFTNNSTDASSYTWDFGDGNISTDENPSHTYGGDGTYLVELIATNECGDDTITQEITIVTLPEAGFSADARIGCAPLTVSFLDESTPNTTTWEWTFDGGTPDNSTEQDPVVTYSEPGTYTVELTVSNAAGDHTQTRTDYITVVERPQADFENAINLNIVHFNNTSSDAAGFFWDFGDGETSMDENPFHVYDQFGTYLVMLVADNGVCSDTSYREIVVDGTPGVSASDEFPCPFENSPEDCGDFDGIPGDGPSDNAPDDTGKISDHPEALSIYPNPNDGVFNVRWTGESDEPVNMRIISSLGQMVHQQEFDAHYGFIDEQLSLNNLKAGAYMILLRQGDDQLMQKIIVGKR